MTINRVTQEEINRAVQSARQPYKVNHFNIILKETVPWVILTPPIYEIVPPRVELCNEVHGSTKARLSRLEISEGVYVYENDCGQEVPEPEPETFIRVTVGPAVLDIRQDQESKREGGNFFADFAVDAYDFNLGGLSTTVRGPLQHIAHVYMNRGSSWGSPQHKCPHMGYAMYLAYQISHELKRGSATKAA